MVDLVSVFSEGGGDVRDSSGAKQGNNCVSYGGEALRSITFLNPAVVFAECHIANVVGTVFQCSNARDSKIATAKHLPANVEHW